MPLGQGARAVGAGDVHPLGQRARSSARRRRTPPPRRRAGRRPTGSRAQLGEGDGRVVLVAAPQPGLAAAYLDQDAHAVPLHLVLPLVPRRHVGAAGARASDAWPSSVRGQRQLVRAFGATLPILAATTSSRRYEMRAIWKGAVSFGLVSVPVKLYSATESHDVSFRQVHAKDGGRIKYQRVCSIDGEEVEYADIAKGYETEDGEMVILTDDDMAALPSDVVARDRGREVRAQRPDRPDALREVLLPRAGEDRRQAVRPAPPGAARRRPDGRGDRRAPAAHHGRRAAGQGRRDRAPDDDVARRDPQARLHRRDRRGEAGRGEDGEHARRDPGRRLRAERVRGRLRRGRRGDGEDQDRGRRGQADPDLHQVLRRGRRPAGRAPALGRRGQDRPRRVDREKKPAKKKPAKKAAAKKTAAKKTAKKAAS